MTDPLQTLTTCLTRIGTEAERLRHTVEAANRLDPGLSERLTVLAETAESVAKIQPGDEIADSLDGLRSGLRTLALPEEDPDFDDSALLRIQGVQGRLFMALADAFEAVTALGRSVSHPSVPEDLSVAVPQAGNEDLLRGIAAQLDDVVEQLDRLEQAGAEPTGFAQQQGLLEFYLGKMRVQIDLARMQLTVGERTVDFAALARATGAMTDLTADFMATIREWADRVTDGVRQFAAGISRTVRAVAVGIRTATAEILRRRAATPPEPQSATEGFDLALVHEMIWRGETPPRDWWPLIETVDLGFDETVVSGGATELKRTKFTNLQPIIPLTALRRLDVGCTSVIDLKPLVGITALESLGLSLTRVNDLTPLAGMAALQELFAARTSVREVTPLAGMTKLHTLDLSFTPISDVSPLAETTSLLNLNLRGTQLSDVTPLAQMTALDRLDLGHTRVSDLTPLPRITALRYLSLESTQVRDVTPLATMTALRLLDLADTQVSDVTPLAGLTALQTLYLLGTQVSDVTPLAGMAALHILDLTGTQVTDVTPLRHIRGLRIIGGPEPRPLATASRLIDRLLGRRR